VRADDGPPGGRIRRPKWRLNLNQHRNVNTNRYDSNRLSAWRIDQTRADRIHLNQLAVVSTSLLPSVPAAYRVDDLPAI